MKLPGQESASYHGGLMGEVHTTRKEKGFNRYNSGDSVGSIGSKEGLESAVKR